MEIELAWLRTFIEVVDAGGFTRAAQRLHLSQPRVSAHIAALEKAVNAELLTRVHKPPRPTDSGNRLLRTARAVLTDIDDAVAGICAGEHELSGTVTVGSHPSGSATFLPPLLAEFISVHPGVKINVFDGNVRQLEQYLHEHRVDLAIRSLRPEPASRSLAFRPLWREPLVLVAPIELRSCGNRTYLSWTSPSTR